MDNNINAGMKLFTQKRIDLFNSVTLTALMNDIIYAFSYLKCEFIVHIYRIKHHTNRAIKKKSQEWVSTYVGVRYQLSFPSNTT